jgi:hypothetical protein
MELLISPAVVAERAFRAPDFIEAVAVSEAVILAAEQKFIRPVLGAALCDRLREGAYPLLLDEYVVPPLALYVKALMLPSLAVQAGAAGVVEAHGPHLARADGKKVRAVVRRLRAEALALMKRAVEHIEVSNGAGAAAGAGAAGAAGIAGAGAVAAYPEYDARGNVLNRCSMEGGIVLARRGGGR